MAARYCHILLTALILIGCSTNEPTAPTTPQTHGNTSEAVYQTDTTEWFVRVFASGVLYGSSYAVDSPYHIPTREEAAILKTCVYPSSERFVTSDGYTFGMPSASVTKAGAKTKYSVLGLYIRPTVITIGF